MPAYYNDNDPFIVEWLRELIRCGQIADGEVDGRSILDVRPADLAGFDQCHFFAGIGGWSHALRIARWPDARAVWTASCPCQPLSGAGLRKGHVDQRHLWPALFALVAECRPARIFGEQVASADGREWLAGIRADLESVGYAVGAADLCAAGVGAPHIRQRLFWLADARHDARAARPARSEFQSGSPERQEPRGDGATSGLADARCRGDEPGQRSRDAYGADGAAQGEAWQRERRGLDAGRSGGGLDFSAGSGRERFGAEPAHGIALQADEGRRRLADADGRISEVRDLQRSGQHGQQSEDDAADRRLADAEDADRRRGECRAQAAAGQDGLGRVRSGGDCAAGALADAECGASGRRADLEISGAERRAAAGGAGAGHDTDQQLADADAPRLQGRADVDGNIREEHERAPIERDRATGWSDAVLVLCRDGKARRIGAGIQPVAHGVPARVGRLRGYGNAIVPQVAAAFIEAVIEIAD